MSVVSPTELLPWQRESFAHFLNLIDRGKLAHAYLLEGQAGLGKLGFAKYFAHYLLCESPQQQQPCHQCSSCLLVAAGNHPDQKLIAPLESKKVISIDQIRATLSFMANTSHQGGRKVIIIAPAEAMNMNSANALLKALEEPADGTMLLLISHQPAQLMATIRSRCQTVKMKLPELSEARDWLESKNVRADAEALLKLAHGAPLKALQLADEDALHERSVLHEVLAKLYAGNINMVQAGVKCGQFSIHDNIDGMMLCVADLLEFIQSRGQCELLDKDILQLANKLKPTVKVKALHQFYTELISARKALNSGTNPNPQLLLESLFYQWAGLTDNTLAYAGRGSIQR